MMLAFAEAIHAQHDMRCECCLPSAATVLQSIHAPAPQVVVLDLDSSTLDAVRHLAALWPATRLIVLSDEEDELAVDNAIEAGAWGYLSKSRGARGVIDAIRRIIAGEMVIPDAPNP